MEEINLINNPDFAEKLFSTFYGGNELNQTGRNIKKWIKTLY
jgi:hypothetical protein